ncbi:MAG: DUF1566 domain-containing protein [Sulfuricurvum sp.]|nr:DUF1566 domain-containing protein [Sulfuricurvum sp.]
MVKKIVAKVKATVARFIVNKDNTITDQKTGLQIVQDPTLLGDMFNKALTFDEAVKAVADLNVKGYAGHKDWRLPSVEELCGMIDRTKHDPCYDTKIFKGKFDNWYWSGETCAWSTGSAWVVGSGHGGVHNFGRGLRSYVLPVRSSQ